MMSTDEELLQALREGRLWAFQAVYRKHGESMVRFATQLLGNQADAEDAVQEAFLTLHRKIAGFRGRSSLATWLYRVLVNRALKIRKRRRPMESLDETTPLAGAGPPGALASAEAGAAMAKAIDALPERQRVVFTLSEIEGFTTMEIGEILGLRSGTVRFHLCKAREGLRGKLRPYFGNPDARIDARRSAVQ